MKGWLYMTNTSMNRVRYCKKENKTCVRWVDKYFKDCLCNIRDHFSFGFGIVSLIAWGVAEIPQIITNFRTKSSHGVSLLFLLGWFIGDLFNLAGCLLEPATLPTQFYTAILYTISTIVLVLQSMYYDYLYKLLKRRQNKVVHDEEDDQEIKKPLNAKPTDQESIPIPSTPVKAPTRRYYTSARSLAGSDTPPFRSYLKARSGPSAFEHIDHSSSDDEETNDANAIPAKRGTTSLPRQIPRPAAKGALMAVSLNLPIGGNALAEAYRGFTGRRMLSEPHTSEHSLLGQWLGWMMAAIYMGGRVPQIVWNIKRGSVEGLNPLMFVFALIANVAYVASILVRHTEWEEIKANMPWLLDAVVCVVLDLFIIVQYVYYKHMRKRNTKDEDQDHYEEAQKPVVA